MSDAIPHSIFRAYDIRGVVGETFTAQGVYRIARAFGSMVQEAGIREIVVARDGRLSGPVLIASIIQGLVESGLKVFDIGCVPTPLLYFATYHFKTGTGIMLTGSHNPPNYNGMKLMLDGRTLFGEEIQEIRRRAEKSLFFDGVGEVSRCDVKSAYITEIAEQLQLKKHLKVVVDGGNGAAGVVVPDCLRAIGCEVIELFCEVDGRFPNHHPDPSNPENLKALIARVAEEQADCGLAFDGDGDRLGLVTEKGDIIWADRQLMLLAQDILSRNPNAQIVYDVKCSRHLSSVIEAAGGIAVMTKTGHSFIKAKMRETGALLGGEMSGHLFVKERWYGFDDACYGAARLLEIFAERQMPASDIFEALPDAVNTPELHVALSDERKFHFMDRLVLEGDFEHGIAVTIDGLRVEFESGWGLVRVSNTTPNLVCRFEADSTFALEEIQARFKDQMLKIDPLLDLSF